MQFKKFLDIDLNVSNYIILFKNNKIIYDSDLKTFQLDTKFLNIDYKNITFIGIGESDKKMYSAEIESDIKEVNIAYKSLIELDIRNLLAVSSAEDILLMGRANQLLYWIKSNKYSGYSGELTKFDSNEEVLFCPSTSSMIYPSISPCVLAMIVKGDEILLARNAMFPKGLYSILAGFIEVSESAEETVKREVFEEVNLEITNIKYFGSQPWPFPSQLMLGYICDYKSGEIQIDEKEIIEANWYRYDKLPLVPPTSSLSGQLINYFVEDRS